MCRGKERFSDKQAEYVQLIKREREQGKRILITNKGHGVWRGREIKQKGARCRMQGVKRVQQECRKRGPIFAHHLCQQIQTAGQISPL